MINLLFVLLFYIVKMLPPILCAVVVFHLASKRLAYFFRMTFVVPMVIPLMVFLLVWKYLYQPEPYGAINQLLILLQLEDLTTNWLGNPKTALGSIIFLGFPWISTIGVLIYLAGLQNIDESIYEAAEIDGAGPIARFFYIELPLIVRQVKINLVLGLVETIQEFGIIIILTGGTGGASASGGPLNATTLPGLQMYKEAFVNYRYGYASAIGVILFLTILTLILINNRYLKPQD